VRSLELDRDHSDGIVLAQGVPLPIVGHEDAGEIGVALEADTEHVEDLPFPEADSGPYRGQ
jgi:hypothetical protein